MTDPRAELRQQIAAKIDETEWRDPADVELVARALAASAYGSPDDHAPWHYTEFGVICACGAPMRDEQCLANWDHMPEDHKDNWRPDARAALSALSTAGRLRDTADVGRCGLVCEPLIPQSQSREVCALPAGHAGWHRSDSGCEWGERTEETTDG